MPMSLFIYLFVYLLILLAYKWFPTIDETQPKMQESEASVYLD